MVKVLAAYDLLLVAAILMLEQHYVVDIIVGLPVAGLAILVTGKTFGLPSLRGSNPVVNPPLPAANILP